MTAYLLNLADLAFTMFALLMGVQEANPPMQNVPFMVFYKVIIIGLLCWLLSLRSERIARYGLYVCTAYYGAVCVYHIVNIASLWVA